MASYVFKLSYSQISCSRCGINRIRGVDCPDCGCRPQSWEIDTNSLTRRQAALRAQALLAQPASPLHEGPLGTTEFLHAELFGRLGTWMSAFLEAAAATAETKGQGTRDLEATVAEFVELRAMVQNSGAKRPLRALVKVLREVVSELESVIDAYLAALLATTPLQAQNHGAAAQRHLDRSAELAEQANTVAETLNVLTRERNVAQIQADLLTRTLRAYDAPDLLALDTVGRDELQDVTSSRGVVGSGLLFTTNHVLAQSLFDPDQFRDVLRRAYEVFRSNPTVLRELVAAPSFEEDFKRAVWELFDGSMEAVHAVDNATHSRQAGRALFGIASSLVEGPGQFLATVLLRACGRKCAAYTNLRHKNATELVAAVQQEPALHGLLNGLDNDLRTGRAHALVRYEEEFAVIERKSNTRTVAWTDVIDGIFQGYETVHACQLALLQALGELGFTGFGVDDLWRTLGLTAEQMVITSLETMNCQDVTLTVDANRWRIEARTRANTRLPTLIAMLQPYLPEDLDELVLTAHQKDETHILAGPLAPWRDYSAAPKDSDAQAIALLRAQLSWTYDDSPWISVNFLRRWTAGQAAGTLEAAPAAAVARLRSLRELAVLAGDDELAWALSGVIRYKRLGQSSDATAELSLLEAWCSVPAAVPEWW
ncbi:hypothetical protein ACFV3N_22980 [Streptomyces bauhiniae]|uniref:hypothetical protein n=1 Tax=Streptomyces bauhiniae TaxID=2340725 RepID=UPI00364A9891